MTRIESVTWDKLARVSDQIMLAQAILDDPKQDRLHSMARQSIAVFEEERKMIAYSLEEVIEP